MEIEMSESSSVETILIEILQSKKRLPVSQNECFVCRKPSHFQRSGDTIVSFCSNNCNEAEYYASYLFPMWGWGHEEEDRRLSNIPREIQPLVILFIFDYRIESHKEWEQLMRLKHYLLLIDDEVIPYFHYIDEEVLHMMKDEIERLKSIRKFEVNANEDYDWSEILRSMKELVDLDLTHQSEKITIHTENLTQLTRLVCIGMTSDSNLKGLVNLRTLVIKGGENPPKITDQGLSYVKNITRLDIIGTIHDYGFSQLPITVDGYKQLRYLKKLVLKNVNSDVITNDHVSGLTQLRKLRLEETQIVNIETLTNLEVLYINNNDENDVMNTSISKLVNLTKFSSYPGYLYKGMTELTKLKKLIITDIEIDGSLIERDEVRQIFDRLTNLEKLDISDNFEIENNHITKLTKLKRLNLDSNKVISDEGITLLTHLTFLNLRDNEMITPDALKHLKNLRRIRESGGRTYSVENGVITLF